MAHEREYFHRFILPDLKGGFWKSHARQAHSDPQDVQAEIKCHFSEMKR